MLVELKMNLKNAAKGHKKRRDAEFQPQTDTEGKEESAHRTSGIRGINRGDGEVEPQMDADERRF
jgi:hypothetical protein